MVFLLSPWTSCPSRRSGPTAPCRLWPDALWGTSRHAVFANTEAGSGELLCWLEQHRPVPVAHLRELRELMRRCDGLKAMRVQEINRRKSGTASVTVAASITDHIAWLEQQIEETLAAVRSVVAADPATMLAEVPDIAEITPGFRLGRISRMGSERLRRALYMCSLSSRRRNPASGGFVQRMAVAHAIVWTLNPFALETPLPR